MAGVAPIAVRLTGAPAGLAATLRLHTQQAKLGPCSIRHADPDTVPGQPCLIGANIDFGRLTLGLADFHVETGAVQRAFHHVVLKQPVRQQRIFMRADIVGRKNSPPAW